ncbi:hypothetical protein [Chryseobacterium sp. KCF3-3]|uniref:hypothetical protein n=1 Tax=Chryseobacterium sp. KCF3-3 TaxID=3231511 RepID=UPI0038B33F70
MKIEVKLPIDRTKTGTLTLKNENGEVLAGPFSVQGKGTGGNDTMRENADTPTGEYILPERPFLPPKNDADGIKKFGVNSRIIISPVSGDAMTASTTRHMDMLRIHGGAPSATGGLRWTQGCLRLSDADMESLLNGLAFEAFAQTMLSVDIGVPTDFSMPSVNVSVSEEDIDPVDNTPDTAPTMIPSEYKDKEGKDGKEGKEGSDNKEGESDGKEGESDGSEDSEHKEGESDGKEGESDGKEGESDGSEDSENKEGESDGKEGESDGSEDSEGKEGMDSPLA